MIFAHSVGPFSSLFFSPLIAYLFVSPSFPPLPGNHDRFRPLPIENVDRFPRSRVGGGWANNSEGIVGGGIGDAVVLSRMAKLAAETRRVGIHRTRQRRQTAITRHER